MDALGNYLGVLWKESMGRMAGNQAHYNERDYAAYDRQLARKPQLAYSPVTCQWQSLRQPAPLYLAARNGVTLRQPDGNAA